MAEPETMDGVVPGPPPKRKAEDGLDKEARKKPRAAPNSLPPVRKPGGFMQSIQLPGFTAAPATVRVLPAPRCSAS